MSAYCGTEAGYARHRRASEPACMDCRAAVNRTNRARRTGTLRRPPSTAINWMDDRRCKDKPTEFFYPAQGEPFMHIKAFCDECPVRIPCLEEALRTCDKYGFWGGKSEHERENIRRNRRRRRREARAKAVA